MYLNFSSTAVLFSSQKFSSPKHKLVVRSLNINLSWFINMIKQNKGDQGDFELMVVGARPAHQSTLNAADLLGFLHKYSQDLQPHQTRVVVFYFSNSLISSFGEPVQIVSVYCS